MGKINQKHFGQLAWWNIMMERDLMDWNKQNIFLFLIKKKRKIPIELNRYLSAFLFLGKKGNYSVTQVILPNSLILESS